MKRVFLSVSWPCLVRILEEFPIISILEHKFRLRRFLAKLVNGLDLMNLYHMNQMSQQKEIMEEKMMKQGLIRFVHYCGIQIRLERWVKFHIQIHSVNLDQTAKLALSYMISGRFIIGLKLRIIRRNLIVEMGRIF